MLNMYSGPKTDAGRDFQQVYPQFNEAVQVPWAEFLHARYQEELLKRSLLPPPSVFITPPQASLTGLLQLDDSNGPSHASTSKQDCYKSSDEDSSDEGSSDEGLDLDADAVGAQMAFNLDMEGRQEEVDISGVATPVILAGPSVISILPVGPTSTFPAPPPYTASTSQLANSAIDPQLTAVDSALASQFQKFNIPLPGTLKQPPGGPTEPIEFAMLEMAQQSESAQASLDADNPHPHPSWQAAAKRLKSSEKRKKTTQANKNRRAELVVKSKLAMGMPAIPSPIPTMFDSPATPAIEVVSIMTTADFPVLQAAPTPNVVGSPCPFTTPNNIAVSTPTSTIIPTVSTPLTPASSPVTVTAPTATVAPITTTPTNIVPTTTAIPTITATTAATVPTVTSTPTPAVLAVTVAPTPTIPTVPSAALTVPATAIPTAPAAPTVPAAAVPIAPAAVPIAPAATAPAAPTASVPIAPTTAIATIVPTITVVATSNDTQLSGPATPVITAAATLLSQLLAESNTPIVGLGSADGLPSPNITVPQATPNSTTFDVLGTQSPIPSSTIQVRKGAKKRQNAPEPSTDEPPKPKAKRARPTPIGPLRRSTRDKK
ncbi:hypothetical protein BDN72DRAFT_115583 [Pluteus cervinus]|uniref:Uncharacterized protein n=1 Tax=Pluteus cervinus TaxID=181527 RepID=A0ACD3AMS4_9AGAR|nr:hypothetical protein BDN72DRAFT_115583 [Pluteus cervinus]